MVQAMTSGHRGSLATLHADTPAQTCGRLETMCMMADIGLPLTALRRQVALAVDLIVQSARLHSGRRLVTHVSEVELDERTDTYVINDVGTMAPGAYAWWQGGEYHGPYGSRTGFMMFIRSVGGPLANLIEAEPRVFIFR